MTFSVCTFPDSPRETGILFVASSDPSLSAFVELSPLLPSGNAGNRTKFKDADELEILIINQ